MTHNPWSPPSHPQQSYQPAFGPQGAPPPPPVGPGAPAQTVKTNQLLRVFPIGMAVVAALSLVTSFLQAYKTSATLGAWSIVEVRTLLGHRTVRSSDGETHTGFDTSLLLRGEFVNQWIVLPIAAVVVLLSLVLTVALAHRARGWWATPVIALIAALTQFFWAVHLASFPVKIYFDDVSLQQRVDQYGARDAAVGAGTWLWMALGLAGAALSIAELVRAKRAGTAVALWSPNPAPQGKHWSLMGASAVLAVLLAAFTRAPIAWFVEVMNDGFYTLTFYGFLTLVVAAAVLGATKRWRAAWVTAATAYGWEFVWFFVCALQSENQLWSRYTAGAIVWLVASVAGAAIAGIGLRAAAVDTAPRPAPAQPAPAPYAGFGGHYPPAPTRP
ncbi:hypothetical protein V6D40_03335 [Corynebacterium sp. Q4381]|uniref:hypothetical protein n=1 Tax=Corynebacterium sp. Marseille-Q4381 TaxID=3121597 RepID=UPI002FE5FA8C